MLPVCSFTKTVSVSSVGAMEGFLSVGLLTSNHRFDVFEFVILNRDKHIVEIFDLGTTELGGVSDLKFFKHVEVTFSIDSEISK